MLKNLLKAFTIAFTYIKYFLKNKIKIGLDFVFGIFMYTQILVWFEYKVIMIELRTY